MDFGAEMPLVDKTVPLEKFPGKGGWTFVRIPEGLQGAKNHFGWKKVRGFIDNYEVSGLHLMPMGKGQLFLPVKAGIRKVINKQAGELVKLVLFATEKTAPVTEHDFLLCLEEEPEALRNFHSFPVAEQERFLAWIAAEESEDQKVERMAQAITRIIEGQYLWKQVKT